MHDVASLWESHKEEGWPRFSSPHEGELMTLDTVISGCVVYYLEQGDGLDPQRVEILESCLADLEGLLPDLPDEGSKQYFERLHALGRRVLSPGPESP